MTTYLVRLPREIIRRFNDARDAAVEVGPTAVVGGIYTEGETGFEGEFEVDLAVFARVGGVRVWGDGGGEGSVEVCFVKLVMGRGIEG
jgi:hypothetical protein